MLGNSSEQKNTGLMEFTWWLSVLLGYWNKLTDCIAYKFLFWRLKSEITVPARLGEGPLLSFRLLIVSSLGGRA